MTDKISSIGGIGRPTKSNSTLRRAANTSEIERLRDFARNVAGLDDRLLNDPTILKQWRDDARLLLNTITND